VAEAANAVFAVGLPGMKGLHSLVRVLDGLRSFGVPPTRIVPVVNRAPKTPPARAQLTATHSALAGGAGSPLPSPVFLPDKRVEDAVRDGLRLPAALTEPLAGAFAAVAGAGRGPKRPGRAGVARSGRVPSARGRATGPSRKRPPSADRSAKTGMTSPPIER